MYPKRNLEISVLYLEYSIDGWSIEKFHNLVWVRSNHEKSSHDNCKIINKQNFWISKKTNVLSTGQVANMKNTLAVSGRAIIVLFVPLEQWIFSGKSYITIFSI